jgi:hypothetical protein
MTDPQEITVGIPAPVAGPLGAKLRELRGLPVDAPENDLYDTHPGVICLTGNWTRTALELARAGNEMLAAKDAELAAVNDRLGAKWEARAQADLEALSAIIDPEMEHLGPLAEILRKRLFSLESKLASANHELSELRATVVTQAAEIERLTVAASRLGELTEEAIGWDPTLLEQEMGGRLDELRRLAKEAQVEPQPASSAERTPVDGTCCSCGYNGAEDTPCQAREDRTHCEHWWDGPEERVDAGEPAKEPTP